MGYWLLRACIPFCIRIAQVYMRIVQFFKRWALLCSIAVGMIVYIVFRYIPTLEPFGQQAGPQLQKILPLCLFAILYVTFCKIEVKDLRPRTWHFLLQGIRTLLSAAIVLLISLIANSELKLITEGAFICVICPTAAAAAVVTEKLGGSIGSLTIYTVIANVVTSIIIPLFFPMVERSANMPFFVMSLIILRNVTTVLILPLLMAFLTRRFFTPLSDWIRAKKNLGFYMWCFNLTIVSGLTLHNILDADVSILTLIALLIVPLVVSLLLFSIGKAVGRPYGENITAGQALGQKNTIVGIWLTITFLNPLAAIAPGAYLVWQNLINALQLRYVEKHGYLKW